MSERKSEIIKELESHIEEVNGLHYTKIAAVNDLANSAYKARRALEQDMEETPRIIRTVEELEALDPDAVTINNAGAIERVDNWLGESGKPYPLSKWHLPAVVIATGEQVRAAREAMEQNNE